MSSRLGLESALNPEQLAAVSHGDGPQLVVAGAGSGKTRVITYRIAWLIEQRGVEPWQIAAVTFTNKAAQEMRQRVHELLAIDRLESFVGTFHRFSLMLLRRYGERVGLGSDFAIFDGKDQIELVKRALALEELADTAFPPRAVLSRISSAKNRLLDPDGFERQAEGYFDRKAALVYRRYQGLLEQASAIDFDDMLRLAVRLLVADEEIAARYRSRIRHLLVDEFQDTNHAQLSLVRALVGEDGNLTAVGDEDQGIYRWRGAEMANILEFEQSFPGAVIRKLERNYRSTQTILDASGALVAHNLSRRGKRLWTDAGSGEPLELYRAGDETDEASWVVRSLMALRGRHQLAEMAILVRTHAQTRSLEEQLLRHGLPYVLVAGTRFYDRAEVKDLVAYLRLLRNPRDEHSLRRILNQPPRGIGNVTVANLEERADELAVPLWDVIASDGLGGFSGRAAAAIRAFRDTMLRLIEAARQLSLPELLALVLDETGYANLYRDGSEESKSRLENVDELLSAAQEWSDGSAGGGGLVDLTGFLDHVALVADIDEWQGERGISILTLHAAKGLEFPVVVVTGLEDGILPHFNASDDLEGIEEERRLLYVGMTRAKQRLLLTCCRRRRVAGRFQDQLESPFVGEIPAGLVVERQSPTLFAGPRTQGVYRFFGRAEDPLPAASVRHETSSSGGAVVQGSRVRHPTLGPGVVLEVSGAAEDERLTVYFERSGKRRLLARYARLEVL